MPPPPPRGRPCIRVAGRTLNRRLGNVYLFATSIYIPLAVIRFGVCQRMTMSQPWISSSAISNLALQYFFGNQTASTAPQLNRHLHENARICPYAWLHRLRSGRAGHTVQIHLLLNSIKLLALECIAYDICIYISVYIPDDKTLLGTSGLITTGQ